MFCSVQGVVCTLHEGDDFGKLALVNDAPRAASIVLREDNCHFLRVDKEDFNRILRVRVGRVAPTAWYQNLQIFLESVLYLWTYVDIDNLVWSVPNCRTEMWQSRRSSREYINHLPSFSVPSSAMKMGPNGIFCLSHSCGLEFAKCSVFPYAVQDFWVIFHPTIE